MKKTDIDMIPEETIEQKLDRINQTLETTMQEIELVNVPQRIPSRISYMTSCASSYCHFEWADDDQDLNTEFRIPEGIESTLELVLANLDRTQMMLEDFWSESVRNQLNSKTKNEELEKYLQKLEKENRELRSGEISRNKNTILNLRKNKDMELQRKKFDEELSRLDILKETYESKYKQISLLQENLMIKESLLEQKEKQLRNSKSEFEKQKQIWEQVVINNTLSESPMVAKNRRKLGIQDPIAEEAPPPIVLLNSCKSKEIFNLQQELKALEENFKLNLTNEERSKAVTQIDQLKNKIAKLRSEQAMIESSKSSKIMKEMRIAMEKEVNHEENLRRHNLEKYSVKGMTKIGENQSLTPNSSLIRSKRFLFED
jgi:hypothetical protein